ncbi:hypothetical protein [Paenibacillus sp. 1781tsa1]|uniref:hypothetical protein n=1 Tax=Paenibacillus sp. 1781tsa1 TaxID=2953810 RepID=UPI00209E51BA|nr:hypothetical protein [Paenibacillus sp. 1781tsa1]MCP1182298.1 hypothetical protein [Paenibacillus sp. 1781tsa1]
MTDMNHNNNEYPDFNEISGEEKLQALRDLIELTDNQFTHQVLSIGMDTHEEDLIRIEAWRALGMAGSSSLLDEIRHAAAQLVRDSEEDEDVQNYALQTLALLPATEAEITLAQDVLEGNAYILLQGAAFAILTAHKHIPRAILALESLQSHPHFGTFAKRELHSISGSDDL